MQRRLLAGACDHCVVAQHAPDRHSNRVRIGVCKFVTDGVANGAAERLANRVAVGVTDCVTDRIADCVTNRATNRVADCIALPDSDVDADPDADRDTHARRRGANVEQSRLYRSRHGLRAVDDG